MLFQRAVSIDWTHVNKIRADQTTASIIKESKSWLAMQYTIGDKVLIILDADKF
jgi:hypothetical protein